MGMIAIPGIVLVLLAFVAPGVGWYRCSNREQDLILINQNQESNIEALEKLISDLRNQIRIYEDRDRPRTD